MDHDQWAALILSALMAMLLAGMAGQVIGERSMLARRRHVEREYRCLLEQKNRLLDTREGIIRGLLARNREQAMLIRNMTYTEMEPPAIEADVEQFREELDRWQG